MGRRPTPALDNDRAVLAGITRSGPVVTAAALCITIVFLGFAAGGLVAVKEIGVGMAVAVLLDVTVVRGLLLPATMTLLGDEWNWWAPAWGRRRPNQRDRSGGPTAGALALMPEGGANEQRRRVDLVHARGLPAVPAEGAPVHGRVRVDAG